MSDYLSNTEEAISPMFAAIANSSDRAFQLGNAIHHLTHLESYLLGKDHNGWGPMNHDDWIKEAGEPPKIDDVHSQRFVLQEMVEARNETINTLCSSILMIAQTGIKLTIGAPAKWKPYEKTLLSSQQECLLGAIWHGRNFGAHAEGLTPGTPSHKYFVELSNRRGVNVLSPTMKYPCKFIVKDLLGWIETHSLDIEDVIHQKSYPSPYAQDMARIGALPPHASP